MGDNNVVFGDDGFATESGWSYVHCINQSTGELLCSDHVWVVVGTGLPAGAFLNPPPEPEDGKAIVRQGDGWVLVDDFRGKTAYNKQTKIPELISALGFPSYELTFSPPSSPFDVWSEVDECWIKDSQAEQDLLTQQAIYQRSSRLGEASNEIAALLDALDPDVISGPYDAVQAKLLEWKQYRAALAVIDCSAHPVQWPAKPV